MTRQTEQKIVGHFAHVIYSPRGEIEGVMLDVEGSPTQLVFDKHDAASTEPFLALRPGQAIEAQATPQEPSGKGKPEHAVLDFKALVAVDGRPPAEAATPEDAGYSGRVVRFNYARHGEINGVVLDTGDFLHLRPDGSKLFPMKVGDKVWASGDAQQLATGSGWAVEVAEIEVTKA